MAMHSAAHAELMTPEFTELYIANGDAIVPQYAGIVNVKKQEHNPHKILQYAMLGITPAKPEGTPFPTDEPVVGASKSYVPKSYGQKVEVTEEMLEDDQYNLARRISGDLGRGDLERLEEVAAEPFNNAFDTGFVGFESATSLISTGHVTVKTKETQANRASGAVSLSQAAIDAEITRAYTLKSESGQRMNLLYDMALIPPQLRAKAYELLGSELKPFEANNTLNSLRPEGLQMRIWRYLSSATAWFLAAMNRHNVNLYVKRWPTFRSWDHPDTGSLFLGSGFRITSGFDEWRGIGGNPGL